jgi:hypothetical protein
MGYSPPPSGGVGVPEVQLSFRLLSIVAGGATTVLIE